MKYLYLTIAIIAEVLGTSMLKQSDGFARIIPGVVAIVAYVIALYLLSLALRAFPTGILYAIWSGLGIVLIATVAWVFQGQKLDAPAVAGMALIIIGICVMNLFSKTGMQ